MGNRCDDVIMAIDQGSTASKVMLVNSYADIVAESSKGFIINYPDSGWVEFDACSVLDSVIWGIRDVLEKSGLDPKKIRSIGITNQREKRSDAGKKLQENLLLRA